MLNDTEKQFFIELLTKLTASDKSGFHPITPNRKYDYIYVKAQDKPANSQGVWYRMDEEDCEQYLDPIKEARFEGDLVEVTLVKIQTKFGPQLKIDLIFDTGKELLTIIRSGASTFSEGILRALMCTDAIANPINIIPQRADKSDKAVFGLVKMSGKNLILQKDMPRLIVWNPKSKPTLEEVASTFLPAVNMVREKLGLGHLPAPIDRDAEYEQSKQSASLPSTHIIDSFPIVTDEQIKLALNYLEWDRQKVIGVLVQGFHCERIGSLSIEQRREFIGILEQTIRSQVTN